MEFFNFRNIENLDSRYGIFTTLTPGDDDTGFYDDIRQQMLDEMDADDCHPEYEMMAILKNLDFTELSNFIYKHATMLNDEIGNQIILAIPATVSSDDLTTFIIGILPLFARTIPIVAQNKLRVLD